MNLYFQWSSGGRSVYLRTHSNNLEPVWYSERNSTVTDCCHHSRVLGGTSSQMQGGHGRGVWSCISTVGFGPGQWFRQLVTLASSQLQQREHEGRHEGCGNTHMVMNESCSWGRSRAGGNPAGPHPLTPYAFGYAANHWLGVGAFLPTSWRALAVPSG